MASEQKEGVVFQATEEAATEFFCELEPVTELRLVLLDRDDLFGIYSEWKGQKKVFLEIARQASLRFGLALCYGYYSAVGFVSELMENGQQVASVDDCYENATGIGDDLFNVFEDLVAGNLHDIVESAFNWRHDRWLLEHTPSADRYR